MDLATLLLTAALSIQTADVTMTTVGVATSEGRCTEKTLIGWRIRSPRNIVLIEAPAIAVFGWSGHALIKSKSKKQRVFSMILSSVVIGAGAYGVRTNIKNWDMCHGR